MSKLQFNVPRTDEVILKSQGYHILKKLGEGTFAKVYQTQFVSESEPEKNHSGACKVIDTLRATKTFVTKFLPRELHLLSILSHPYIMKVNLILERSAKYYIFMPLAEKGDLMFYIQKNGPTPENQTRVWIWQLVLAVQYLHTMEIAHRDIKCENILLTENLDVRLTDFGFGRQTIDEDGKSVLTDTFCGSMLYMPPEIIKNQPYNPKVSDMWSIGVTLFFALNRAYPFYTTNTSLMYKYQLRRMYRSRYGFNVKLSDEVKSLIDDLLEPRVTNRWKIEQVLKCKWFVNNPALTTLNVEEKNALDAAMEIRKTLPGNLDGSADIVKYDFSIKNCIFRVEQCKKKEYFSQEFDESERERVFDKSEDDEKDNLT